ncbi:response regulator transcription factor [Synechococcus sp. CCY 9618]|uniref:response regulator transcription factor n=1 Tax=Synechococcus sp. CCY 9618 TaxID=2815602 RepID=UPI001C22A8C6|nr:response regulator transcription factor [Synechococcus sp. CCY 9618]
MSAILPPSVPVDLTPLLPQVRDDGAQALSLLRDVRLVLCLGSRTQLALLMATPVRVLGAATTAGEGFAQVQRHQPALLITSDRLEGGCGVDLVVRVKRRFPRVRTLLVLSQEHRLPLVTTAFQNCCDAIVAESRLLHGSGLQALRALAEGSPYLDPALAVAFRGVQESLSAGLQERLSARERQVLAQVVQGRTNHEIARDLMVSVDTVKTHVRNVLLKLRVRGRIQAVVTGLRLGLIDWPDP